MSVDIVARNGDFTDVTNVAWRLALEFARRAGWSPAGTEEPDGYDEREPWDRTYDPAMGQEVSPPDAVAFGRAVLAGLARPDRDQLIRSSADALDAAATRQGYADSTVNVTLRTVEMLQMVGYLAVRSGGFRIE